MHKNEIRKKLDEYREVSRVFHHRDSLVHVIDNAISTIIGTRRGGKSFRMQQIVDDLVAEKFIKSRKQVCFLDFDNAFLSAMTAQQLSDIQEIFLSMYPDFNINTNLVFAFDEIHKIKGWENYVIDLSRNPNWKIFITGSSSKLLREDIATELRGKSITSEQYPLSFKENLVFKKHTKSYSTKGKADLKRHFDDFLRWGSFPIIPSVKEQSRIAVLRDYFEVMISKDILQRNNVSNPQQCVRLYNYLFANISKPFTYNSALSFLEREGLKGSKKTINQYIDYAEDAFLMFPVPIFTDSVKKEARNYKKLYAIDWALANYNCISWDGYLSRAFENIVYIELRRKYPKVRYYLTEKERKEVDFIISDKNSIPFMSVQASIEINKPETLKREVDALVKTAKYFNIKENFIITLDEEKVIEVDGVKIFVIPAYQWLTEK